MNSMLKRPPLGKSTTSMARGIARLEDTPHWPALQGVVDAPGETLSS